MVEIFDPADGLGDILGRFPRQSHDQADQRELSGFYQPANLLVAKLAPLGRLEGADLAALLIYIKQLSAGRFDAEVHPQVIMALPTDEQVVNFAQVVVGIFGDGDDVRVIDLNQPYRVDFPKIERTIGRAVYSEWTGPASKCASVCEGWYQYLTKTPHLFARETYISDQLTRACPILNRWLYMAAQRRRQIPQ
jgi:hypothetical protein